MTGHELLAKNPAHKVTVWWDGDLFAFVGTVWDRNHSRRLKLVVVDHISDLRARLRPYAEFGQDTYDKLKADRGPK